MIKIFNDDCLALMPAIPDGSIDMILCDLPYGVAACKWDIVIPFEPLWEQYKRIIKPNGAIALFGTEPFSSHLRLSNLKWYKYDWVWEKSRCGNFFQAKRSPLYAHENIHVFYKTQPTYSPQMNEGKPYSKTSFSNGNDEMFGKYEKPFTVVNTGTRHPRSVIKFHNPNKNNLHPTQKPVALLEYLIKTYTLEGETVLDNCMGSGSTGVACKNLNRKFIGIEKEEKYFNIAKERLS